MQAQGLDSLTALVARLGLGLVVALASACGGDSTEESAEPGCKLEDSDYTLGAEEVDHACRHLDEGPYGELVAGDDLGNLHMLYTVELEAQSDGSYAGSLGFVPRASATHVFYVFEGAELRFHDDTGEPLCVAETIEEVSCETIERAQMLDLVEGQRIELRFAAMTEPTTRILAERR